MVAPARREDRRHRQRHPAGRRRRRRTAPSCSCSAGAARGARRPRRCAASGRAGQQGRARAPAAPEPVPGRPRRRRCAATEGARARDEPRPARRSWCAPSTSSTRRASRKVQGVPFRAAELEATDPGDDRVDDATERQRRAGQARPQGLPVRPGGPLVPGLRRLRDPHRDPVAAARDSASSPRTWCSSRASAARPLPVLHEHVRHAHASTAARPRSRPVSRWPVPTSTCGSSAATATCCRSAATT